MKQFDQWNQVKKKLENIDIAKIKCKKRQIWLCKIGENVGNEISKNNPFIRPVLILNSYFGGEMILIIPLTTKYNQKFAKSLYQLKPKNGLRFTSYLVMNQIKTVSKKRLLREVAHISSEELQEIIKIFKKKLDPKQRVRTE